MVTCTELTTVLRVQFLTRSTETSQVGIVCYARATDTGLEIYYSHHLSRSRPVPSSPWGEEQAYRIELSQATVAAIRFNVWLELENTFGNRIKTLPAPLGTAIEKVQF